jgi:hypothetical protein
VTFWDCRASLPFIGDVLNSVNPDFGYDGFPKHPPFLKIVFLLLCMVSIAYGDLFDISYSSPLLLSCGPLHGLTVSYFVSFLL